MKAAATTILGVAATLAMMSLAACGPDDTGPPVKHVSDARPAYPPWSAGMIGKPASQVAHGRGECKGVFDVVEQVYDGKPSGAQVAGWGWDSGAKQAVQHVLFVDTNDRVVGAADGGVSRPDVPAALADVTSKTTGWRGIVGKTTGKVLAVGLTTRNAGCDLGSKDLTPGADS